ncbi:conserved hypothetical protein [Syntrophobacter sp. SbD1]|nr:conserved hypothetical protein [Syntrophobacter sp. SbD1]
MSAETIETKVVARGKKFTICEIELNGSSTLKEFTQTLTGDQVAGTIAIVRYIADNGTPENTSKFNYEGEQIWAIKYDQVRIYCFFDAGCLLILTNGVIKKGQKADPNDLKRAKKLRKAYLRRRS